MEQTDRRTTLDDENIRAQIAAMQIKIERRDEEIKKLQALLGIVPKLEKPPEELGQESIIQRAEARISGQTSMPTAEEEVDPETLEKRQELERLLAELTMLKGEQAQTPAQAARAAMELTGMAPPAAPAAPPQAAGGISMPTPLAPGAQQAVAIEPAMIEPSVASPGDAGAFVPTSTTVVVDENAINQAYWDAYNETLEQRKRQRRVDAEAWAAGALEGAGSAACAAARSSQNTAREIHPRQCCARSFPTRANRAAIAQDRRCRLCTNSPGAPGVRTFVGRARRSSRRPAHCRGRSR